MSRIAEVARLKELEAKIAQEGYGAPDPIWCDYSDELRDAAPWLLAVAGQFQAGHVAALTEIADILEQAGFVAKTAYVRPLIEAARVMGGEQE